MYVYVYAESVMSDSAAPWTVAPLSMPGSSVHGDSSGKNTGVDCHALLWGILPTQELNPGLLHCKLILYHLSQQGNPYIYLRVAGKQLLVRSKDCGSYQQRVGSKSSWAVCLSAALGKSLHPPILHLSVCPFKKYFLRTFSACK